MKKYKQTFRLMENKPNDRNAESRQYEHNAPENSVLSTYKKYVLAAAMDAVLLSNSKRPDVSPIPNGKLLELNSKESTVTNPYATIPIKGSGIPGECKNQLLKSFQLINVQY